MSDTISYTTALLGSAVEKRLHPEPKFFWELHVVVGGNPTKEAITALNPASDYLVGEVPTTGTVFPMAFAVAPEVSAGFAVAPWVSVYASNGADLLIGAAGDTVGKAPFEIPAGSKLAYRPLVTEMPAFQPIYLPLWL